MSDQVPTRRFVPFALTGDNIDRLRPLLTALDGANVSGAVVDFGEGGDTPQFGVFGYDETGTFGFLGFREDSGNGDR